MNNTIKNKHAFTILAAMSGLGAASLYAAPGLDVNPQAGVVYVSATDSNNTSNAPIRFGQNSTTGGGGAVANNSTIATLTTANPTLNLVYTPLNNVSPTLTNETKGGLLIDPATGNTTIKQGSSAIDTILPGLVRVREQEVFSNDPSVPAADRGKATATPAVTRYGTLNGNTFTPISGLSGLTEAAIETFVSAPTSANAQALLNQINGNATDKGLLSYTTGVPTTVANTGSLTVEGSTTTKGITNSGEISTDSVKVAGTTYSKDGIAGIIERKADGSIHIGPNSLVTNEVGGVQQLSAQNAGGTAININVTNGSDLQVGGVSVATDADVANEAATRAAADVTLQNNLNTEIGIRAAADVTLQNNINTEAATRAAADTAETNARIAADNAEAATRAAADVILQNNINTEATTRAAADVTLQNNITAEATTRAAADLTLQNNITAEAATRAAADVTLQSNITAEATTRASEDTLIRADIASEAATRSAADTQLQANITAETAARVADVNAEETRALAAEAALAGRATALEGRATVLEGRTTALEGRVARAEGRISSLRKGVSLAAALQTPVIEPGKNNALKAGVATVDGAQGFGIAIARRVNASVQVNLDVATDFQTDTAARAGVNYSF